MLTSQTNPVSTPPRSSYASFSAISETDSLPSLLIQQLQIALGDRALREIEMGPGLVERGLENRARFRGKEKGTRLVFRWRLKGLGGCSGETHLARPPRFGPGLIGRHQT